MPPVESDIPLFGPDEIEGHSAVVESDIPILEPTETVPAKKLQPGSFEARRGLGLPEPEIPRAKQKIMQRFGSAYEDTSIVDGVKDIELGWKLGWAQTPDKKNRVIKELYGDQAEVKFFDFGEGNTIEIATKDGKTWRNTEGLYDYMKDLPETAASLAAGYATGGMGLVGRIAVPAISAGLAELGSETWFKKYYEPERSDPYQAAVSAAFMDALGGTIGEVAISPLIRRTIGVKGSAGAEAARKAAERMNLPMLTGGQYTENVILQMQYKQWQNLSEKSAAAALKRFEGMRDSLGRMVDEHGLGAFSAPEIAALAEFASYEIDDVLKTLSTGGTPIGVVLPKLQDALKVFNKAASARKNDLYKEAFDVAVRDGVELDFSAVKSVFDEIEKGVPVVGRERVVGTGSGGLEGSTALARPGEVPAVDIPYEILEEGSPVRYLTPSAELSQMIEKARGVADVISQHNPDGSVIGSLEQMNAIRRSFSEFAWENAGNNQGRLATQVVDAIDSSMSKPVAGASKDYLEAFKLAQEAHGAWRSIMEIKNISKLSDADLSSYQNYIVNLMKPGNGPLVELMDTMFKGTPGAMDAVRAAFIDHLVSTPATIGKTLETFKKKDPRLLNMVLPNPSDRKILENYASTMERYQKSWFSKQAERAALSEGDRALTLFEGNKATIAQNIDDYLKWGGPNAKEAVQTAFLHRMLKAAETEPSTVTGSRVIDADKFVSELDKNMDIVDRLFDKKAKERLMDLYNYGLKIKSTGVRVPALAGQGGSDTGTSLMAGAAAGSVAEIPATAERRGVVDAARQLFSIFVSPRVMAAVLNFDGPVAASRLSGGIEENTLRSIVNVVRVLPDIMTNDAVNYTSHEDLAPLVPQGM